MYLQKTINRILVCGIFVLLFFVKGNGQINTSVDSVVFDTIYYAPDTIKTVQVDTIYEYVEEELAPFVFFKKMINNPWNVFSSLSGGVGLIRLQGIKDSIIISLPLFYGEIGLRNKYLYVSSGISLGTSVSYDQKYSKTFRLISEKKDSIDIVVDEYFEIVGKDTLKRQMIERRYFNRRDTSITDSVYRHKNSYSILNIPFIFGLNYSTKKTNIGIGIGVNISLLKPDVNNVVIDDSLGFIAESQFFRKSSLGFISELFFQQYVTKHFFVQCESSIRVPLQSNYKNYKNNLNVSQLIFLLGVGYRF